MEFAKSSQSSSSSNLPPGCRFYPSEEQLLNYYLHHKNDNPTLQSSSSSSNANAEFYDAIKEINLYNYNPFELPEVTCFRFGYKGRKRHWYCFTEKIHEERERENWRKAGFGYWKRKGKVRDVMGNCGNTENVVLGRRKCFIFYLQKFNGKTSVKTDWFMYEYALIDNFKASFVVCRVFVKSKGRNSISEHALSSCAEESIATVRHIGIQHDGSTVSLLDEDKTHGCDYDNGKIVGQSTHLIEETELNNEVKLPGLAGSTGLLADSFTAHHLTSLIEGDYLEMDDLV